MGKKNKVKQARKKGRVYVKGASLDVARFIPDFDWRFSDNKSADLSLSPNVRKKARERARYEVANNSYATGAGWSIVNSVIPNVPRLQFTPLEKNDKNDRLARQLELDFSSWARSVRLAEKLRSMRFAKYQDGETFAVLHENAKLQTDVKLDISPIDCERVSNADIFGQDAFFNPQDVDGIILDDWGNPVSYRVLTFHPGNPNYQTTARVYSADKVLHWYRRTTPEQHRGISELAPALLLFNYLRRYTYSVVRASEIAADLALILKTNDVDVYGGSSDIEIENPIIETSFSRGSTVTLPDGFDATQLKAEQPTAQFSTLVDELLGAIGASLGLPRLIMRKSATGFTYASARVDLSEMERFISIERDELNNAVIGPLFGAFKKEWELVNKTKLPAATISWYYAEAIGNKIDPQKEATAQQTRIANKTTTLAIEFAKLGLDWEEELEQQAIEKAKIKQLEEQYNVSFDGMQSENGGFSDENDNEKEIETDD